MSTNYWDESLWTPNPDVEPFAFKTYPRGYMAHIPIGQLRVDGRHSHG